MTLADLRKLAIRKQLIIHFRLQNGLECVVTEHGMAKVPGLKSVPDFNLERELESARDFLLEPVVPPDQKNPKNPPKLRNATREELEAMMGSPPAGAATGEHDDE
jgi:hypothetical protein